MSREEKKEVRLVLVGCGRMGRVRAPLFQADQRVKLVAVVDPWKEGGQALADMYGASYYATLAEAFAGSGSNVANACWIANSTESHEAAICAAAKAGVSIFTEKPVAENPESIARIFQVAREAGVALCCGFQRRFDKSYVVCAEKVKSGVIGQPAMASVFFGDHPVPPMEFLKTGGCPFMDLSPHDLDYVRWTLGQEPVEVFASGCSSTTELEEANVLDNAFMFVKFSQGTMVTLQMSRGATYGYDQRCEFFGDKGCASVGNMFETSAVVANAAGYHASRLKFSFPQRFEQAFSAEVAAFAQVVLDGATWPVSERDCIIVQSIAQHAAQSQKEGRALPFTMPPQHNASNTPAYARYALPPHRVRAIGEGVFGKYIRALVTADLLRRGGSSRLTWLPGSSYTRSSGLDWDIDVVSLTNSVDAVYVASPDKLHFEHALACLNAGKHVLVEKPVVFPGDIGEENTGFQTLVDAALCGANGQTSALLVGFQRRFDAEFLRAKAFVNRKKSGRPQRLKIESRDPVPALEDMEFVFNNSCCHDIDMINWLLPEDTVELEWETAVRKSDRSVVEMSGKAIYADGEYTEVIISYCKEHTSYVQRVVIDGKCFGYDFHPAPGQMECEIYANAYKAMWAFFGICCDAASGRKVAGSTVEHLETQAETEARLSSYVKTFAWLKAAQKVF